MYSSNGLSFRHKFKYENHSTAALAQFKIILKNRQRDLMGDSEKRGLFQQKKLSYYKPITCFFFFF